MNEGTRYALETRMRELASNLKYDKNMLRDKRTRMRAESALIKKMQEEHDDIKATLESGEY